MNMRHCALPDRKTTKRTLPYNRQYVILAIYEVLDKNGAEYKKRTHRPYYRKYQCTEIQAFFRFGEQAGGRYRIVRNDGQTVRGIVGIRRATSYNSRSRQHIAIS